MKLWGSKTEAVFDWWSVGHIFTYYALTKFLFLEHLPFKDAILILIFFGYSWEFVERILENMDHHKRFFKEKEGWMNRYMGDILADIVGFLLAWQF
jgi:hypothetical protein